MLMGDGQVWGWEAWDMHGEEKREYSKQRNWQKGGLETYITTMQ